MRMVGFRQNYFYRKNFAKRHEHQGGQGICQKNVHTLWGDALPSQSGADDLREREPGTLPRALCVVFASSDWPAAWRVVRLGGLAGLAGWPVGGVPGLAGLVPASPSSPSPGHLNDIPSPPAPTCSPHPLGWVELRCARFAFGAYNGSVTDRRGYA
mgnify:CR=1 FL=1